jgi:glycerol-3-phosphate dehydrogenase
LDGQVAVIGGGVVGCAVAHALARRGVACFLIEAEAELGTRASGTNSGILHTGFDSLPGALETAMILRSAALREELLGELDVPLLRCGARMRAVEEEGRAALDRLQANATGNGVEVHRLGEEELSIPGEAVTDPAAFTRALGMAATAHGATLMTSSPVTGLSAGSAGDLEVESAGGERLRVAAVVNCAGLQADEVATMAGERTFEVYPRKGEFLVFEQDLQDLLREILLPVPSSAGKGVLVFPTVDGHLVTGPTARDREDKDDWSVEPDAAATILARAVPMFPALEGREPIAAYAGLRPAGRGVNYVIEPSLSLPGLIDVAAIRSTGLSAAFGIGEHVAAILGDAGLVELGPPQRAAESMAAPAGEPWWQQAARRSQSR